jgi:NADH-quinone oxidoreductase subunit J
MDWIRQHWLEWASLLLIAAGVWWSMPGAVARPKAVGLLLALAGTALLATRVDDFSSLSGDTERLAETILFWLFAATAIASAFLMITNRNPVYSALWFALVTLCVCGLFLLQFAPFLAAATTVVYAGAIVVTFVFVIMLAQQGGATAYDQRSRQPLVATVAAFVLLATIIGTMEYAYDSAGDVDSPADVAKSASQTPPTVQQSAANPLSQLATDQPMGRMHALGRSLFGDYLFAVEMAGTLLLVATIGAIAIAPRRRRGTL